MNTESYIANSGSEEEILNYRLRNAVKARGEDSLNTALTQLAYLLDTPRKRDIAIAYLNYDLDFSDPKRSGLVTESDLLDINEVRYALSTVHFAFCCENSLLPNVSLPYYALSALSDLILRFGSAYNARLAECAILHNDNGELDTIIAGKVGYLEWEYMFSIAQAVKDLRKDLAYAAKDIKSDIALKSAKKSAGKEVK